MNTNLILKRFKSLPENLQFQVYDYIEFLISRYEKTINVAQEYPIEEAISPELKTLLEERVENYKKNPHKVKSWKDIELRLSKKNNHGV